ncbi:MAG: hypothetical protein LKJ90_04310 [Faecalibacterium sp.]|jgi:hypothetical protein|nr:hypothetical protein [Faecalibacterium sp.]
MIFLISASAKLICKSRRAKEKVWAAAAAKCCGRFFAPTAKRLCGFLTKSCCACLPLSASTMKRPLRLFGRRRLAFAQNKKAKNLFFFCNITADLLVIVLEPARSCRFPRAHYTGQRTFFF